MSNTGFSSPVNDLPQSVKAVLWSYKTDQLEIDKHKKIIVFQVLNFGTTDAIHWLFKQYTFEAIEKIANAVPLNQWNKKSLSLWRLVLSINPKNRIS